ncbi:response regulator transcription factor [Actinosynnema sp. NPDC047251]|uniref:Response regulatory domain-containing protein n=1 Tax=Saccharothrix espanaensis (strain ATCC 51144 / DSM 44229 / JCM 9112 / NBRC 15066 / NRRL 15764) TaxID=1179773 RepID=K0K3H7_SACES|nr:response regulator transcription factor [Saccharothrix espanaensis]CCH32881.1 hypothetical protein BN6_56220 [Saccharothrix espanaensis DSM 44229]
MISVMAIDDHESNLYGLQMYLADKAPDIAYLGGYGSIAAWSTSGRAVPQVVLLDMLLPDEPDIAWNVRFVHAAGPHVILHTSSHRPALIRKAVEAGARALVLKGDPLSRVAEAVRDLSRDHFYVSSRLAHVMVTDPRAALSFSKQELATLTMIAKGLPRRRVARELNVSESSVRTYLDRAAKRYAAIGLYLAGPGEVVAAMLEDGHIAISPPHTPTDSTSGDARG